MFYVSPYWATVYMVSSNISEGVMRSQACLVIIVTALLLIFAHMTCGGSALRDAYATVCASLREACILVEQSIATVVSNFRGSRGGLEGLESSTKTKLVKSQEIMKGEEAAFVRQDDTSSSSDSDYDPEVDDVCDDEDDSTSLASDDFAPAIWEGRLRGDLTVA